MSAAALFRKLSFIAIRVYFLYNKLATAISNYVQNANKAKLEEKESRRGIATRKGKTIKKINYLSNTWRLSSHFQKLAA